MKNKRSKRIVAIAIMLSLIAGLLFIQSVNAATKVTFKTDHTLKEKGTGKNYGNTSGSPIEFVDGYTKKYETANLISETMFKGSNGSIAYCVQLSTSFSNSTRTSTPPKKSDFEKLSANAREGANLALLYGYPNRSTATLGAAHADDAYIATQVIVWEYTIGFRDNAKARKGTITSGSHSFNGSQLFNKVIDGTPAETVYNKILSDIAKHDVQPSFNGRKISLDKKANGQWKATVTDTNNTGIGLSVVGANPRNVTINRSGNEYTIVCDSPKLGEYEIILQNASTPKNTVGEMLIWGNLSNKNQIVATGSIDPVLHKISIIMNEPESLPTGIEIKKEVINDADTSGYQFEIRRVEGTIKTYIGTYTTDRQGYFYEGNLTPGVYEIEEINIPEGYAYRNSEATYLPSGSSFEGTNPVRVTVVNQKLVSLSFTNIRQAGVIKLQKENTDITLGNHSFFGAEFDVIDKNGQLADVIFTDEKGYGESKELPLGAYTVKESKAPIGYLINADEFKVDILAGVGDISPIIYSETITIPETPQLGKITFIKHDKETEDKAQYESTLNGAVFEIYAEDKETLVDTVECKDSNTATSKELPLGKYYCKEKIAPVGYVVDENFYAIDLEYNSEPEVEIASKSVILLDDVIKGKIKIIKTDGEDKVPLSDITFEVKDNAGNLITTLVTDKNGEAETDDLVYGHYTVIEKETLTNYILDEKPTEVFIEEHSKVVELKISNSKIKGKIKVIKKSDSKVPLEGAKFEVYEAIDIVPTPTVETTIEPLVTSTPTPTIDIEITPTVTIEVTPTPISEDKTEVNLVKVATIITNKKGEAITKALPYGDYVVKEVEAPTGYVLNDKEFTVSIRESEKVYTLDVVNQQIKGRIKIIKIDGETKIPLSGVTFEIRDEKNKVIQEVVTNKGGEAKSKHLEYGKYTVTEKSTGYEYTLDKTPKEVYIKEHGQVVELSLKNYKKPAIDKPVDKPKTGDNTNPVWWYIIIAISLTLFGGLIFLKRRRKFSE